MKNIRYFERKIEKIIVILFMVALLVTTTLFIIIYHQKVIRQKIVVLKQIDTALDLYKSNLTEKLSIVASSSIFMDFLTSGAFTRNELEIRFLTEMSLLDSEGVIGYTLVNKNNNTHVQYGKRSNDQVQFKICYLAHKLDNDNGSCMGILQLYFSQDKILNELSKINSEIKPCETCSPYSLVKNDYFGNFHTNGLNQFEVKLNIRSQHEAIFPYYFIIISIIFCFAFFNTIKIRKLIRKAISNPLQKLVDNIKTQSALQHDPDGLQEVNYLSDQIELWREQIKKIQEFEKLAAIGDMAAQVAHDIRSPLAVMDITLLTAAKYIPQTQNAMLYQAMQSVRDIANNLLTKYRHIDDHVNDSDERGENSLLYPLVELMVAQKVQEWKNNPCELSFITHENAKSCQVKVAANDIKRIISNLLNNAYEALAEMRVIKIFLNIVDDDLQLEIQDSGHGIEADRIEEVISGVSLKHKGKGLGLSTAKKYMDSINGKFNISSECGIGTKIILVFPI